jgi:imidazoleglycerol phosphate dehydratase HisB
MYQMDLDIKVNGDLEVDEHHTIVEEQQLFQ